jgi:hypothetical protein
VGIRNGAGAEGNDERKERAAMNCQRRKFVKRSRQKLKHLCPDIYRWFFAHLNDEEFVTDMNRKKALIESSRGETLKLGIQFPDGTIEVLNTVIDVPRKEVN